MKKLISALVIALIITASTVVMAAENTTNEDTSSNTTTTSTPSTNTSTESEKVEPEYWISFSTNHFKTEDEHYYLLAYGNTTLLLYTGISNKMPYHDIKTAQLTSSDSSIVEFVYKDDTTASINVAKEGTVNLLRNGKAVGKLTVFTTWEEYNEEFWKLIGKPVFIVNGNTDEPLTRLSNLSFSNPAKVEVKLLKNGKIVDFDDKWTLKVSNSYTDKIKLDENYQITPITTGNWNSIQIDYYDKELDNRGGWSNLTVDYNNYDSSKCDINLSSQRGIFVENKQFIVEKGEDISIRYTSEGTDNVVTTTGSDLFGTIKDETIAKFPDGANHYINTLKSGTTTLTIDRTGKETQTIEIVVVDSLIDYRNEHPEVFPEDFVITDYDGYYEEEPYAKMDEEKIKNCDELYAEVSNNQIVKSDVFSSLDKYVDKKLTILSYNYDSETEMESNVTWTFDSNNTTDKTIDFNPNIKISDKKFNDIENDTFQEGLFVDFSHSGNLPSKATVKIDIPYTMIEKYAGMEKTMYLYFYNPETKEYEYVREVNIKDQVITLELDHCSEYYISETKVAGIEEASSSKSTRKLDGEAKWGESAPVAIIALAIVSLTGMVLLKKYSK